MDEMKSTFVFSDYYRNSVTFSFQDHPFSTNPKHVWVICRFHDQWLLTKHPRRGWEFPGGKVEPGETVEEAAKREVYEETGATVSELKYIGQYKVEGKSGLIIKNVYFANIDSIELKEHYMETNGPVFIHHIPKDIKDNHKYSFMMRDNVLQLSLQFIRENIRISQPQN